MGIRLGKTHVKFYAGAFRPGSSGLHRAKPNRPRPADPFEALSGTVEAFEYKSGRPARDVSRLPAPRPKPTDPAAYQDEDVYSLLTELASSSWDSIYATASGPAAVVVNGQKAKRVPKPVVSATAAGVDLPPRPRHVPADPCLQVVETEPMVGEAAVTDAVPALGAVPEPGGPATPAPIEGPPPAPRRGWLNPVAVVARGLRSVLTGRFLRRAS
jgi:hypothetical protein